MAPQSKKKKRLRNKPPFDVKDIVLYGLPFWAGALLAGWYFKGWPGLRSTIVGLILLGMYIGSEIGFAKLSDRYLRKSPGAVVGIVVAGFVVRLAALGILVYLITRFVQLDLLVTLITVAFGFTLVLAISMKDWLRD